MADWNHRSAFEDWAWYLAEKTVPKMTSILLNGKGSETPLFCAPVRRLTMLIQENTRSCLERKLAIDVQS